jgi:hypothetical protein
VSQPTAPDAPENLPAPAAPPAPPAWGAPAAAPFGPPVGTAPTAPPAGAYAPPAGAYAPPAGYAAPAGYPVAPGAYPVTPAGPAYGPAAPARRSSALGFIALALALLAAVGSSVLAAIAAFRIGLGAGREIGSRPFAADFDWSILTPVRAWVLLGEIAFWVGTALGLWALVQGTIAIVTARGRGAGIAAVIIAVLGPIAFGAVVQGFLTAGLAAGTGIGG